jgi:hypothetical protein
MTYFSMMAVVERDSSQTTDYVFRVTGPINTGSEHDWNVLSSWQSGSCDSDHLQLHAMPQHAKPHTALSHPMSLPSYSYTWNPEVYTEQRESGVRSTINDARQDGHGHDK